MDRHTHGVFFLRNLLTFRQYLTKRNAILAALVLGLFAAVAATAWAAFTSVTRLPAGAEGTARELPSVLPVRTVRLVAQDGYTVHRWYSGKIEARRSGALGFERAGQVRKVLVEEGDTVRAGDALAVLDTRVLENQRRQLAAQLDQARASLAEMLAGPRKQAVAAQRAVVRQLAWQMDLARRQYARRKALRAQQVIAQEDLDALEAEFRVLEAKHSESGSKLDELLAGTRKETIAAQQAAVAQLQAQIESVDINLEKSRLTAPYAGVISARHYDEGAVVAAGQAIVGLQEGVGLEARIGVPPAALGGLEPGRAMEVEVGPRRYAARIKALLPVLDSATRTVEVVLALHGDTAVEQVGKLARIAVAERIPEQGFWLPSAALVKEPRGLWGCHVLTPGSGAGAFRVEARVAEVLYLDGERVFVRGALMSGEEVVADGAHRAAVGQLVRPVPANVAPNNS